MVMGMKWGRGNAPSLEKAANIKYKAFT